MTSTLPATAFNSPVVAIVYHSPYGHTAVVAGEIAEGVQQAGGTPVLLAVDRMQDDDWQVIDQAQVMVMGSPVYMGSITGVFKQFMDASSKRWLKRVWAGKLAAGFVNSGGLSGDKLAALQQINLFAMQHGMLWAGLPLMNEGHGNDCRNRLAGFLGLMTQSDNAPTTVTPPEGDRATARWFGRYLTQLSLSEGSVVQRHQLATNQSHC